MGNRPKMSLKYAIFKICPNLARKWYSCEKESVPPFFGIVGDKKWSPFLDLGIRSPIFLQSKSLKMAVYSIWYAISWNDMINIIFKVLWQLLEYAAYNTPVRCSWCSENRLRPQFHQSASSLLPQQSTTKDRRIISYNNKHHAKARKKRSNNLRWFVFYMH